MLFFWSSTVKNLATIASSAWSHLDNPVGRTDDVGIVLNHDNRVALVHKSAKHVEQDANVLEMQSCSGFVEDVERASCISSSKFCSQFDALTLTSRKGVAGLTKFDVTQSDFLQDLNLAKYRGLIGKELNRLIDSHIQNIRDALASEPDFERLSVIALSSTLLARHEDVGQEVHLDGAVTIAATSFTTTSFHVEGESSRLVTSDSCLRKFHEKLADVSKDVCISCWIRARCAAKRTLVNVYYFVDVLQSLNGFVGQRLS